MAFLFDTDAIAELLLPDPHPGYVEWLRTVPREAQFASAISIGELISGAARSPGREVHLENIRERILPSVTILPYDMAIAHVFGELWATLGRARRGMPEVDAQVAATAIHHGLELVTGNVRNFLRCPGLRVQPVLYAPRTRR